MPGLADISSYKHNAMAKQTVKLNSEVNAFLDGQNHPFRNEIEQLRMYILASDETLTEDVKWNGPNYCFEGEDRITIRIQPPKKQAQLIFHRGAKKRAQPTDKLIADKSGLLTWKENDRAIITFKSLEEIVEAKDALKKIITEWIKAAK